MSEADNSRFNAYSSASIVDHHDLRFDAADPLNGSLYLCTARGGKPPENCLSALRAAGLWSAESEKSVADDQREAYKAGLKFVDAVGYSTADGDIVLARFDHPKYPSSSERWDAWLALFDRDHARTC